MNGKTKQFLTNVPPPSFFYINAITNFLSFRGKTKLTH